MSNEQLTMINEPSTMLLQPTGWHVYIVRCEDGTYYTGIARDPAKRLDEHNSPKGGAKYTRSRRPVTLVYVEPAASRSAAAKREYQLKKMPLAKKKMLIGTLDNEQLTMINEQ